MNTIHKYPIRPTRNLKILMPAGARVLHAGPDPNGTPCCWAQVNTSAPMVGVALHCFYTGEPMPPGMDARHVGTFNLLGYVWHCFVDG